MANRAAYLRQQLLHKYNARVTDDWIEGCAAFFLDENPNYSNEELKDQAYEQWLLADLALVGQPVLPASVVRNKENHTIAGKFAVQSQYFMDIGAPAYEQYQELHNKELDEVVEKERDWTKGPKIKKKRMLKMELTDGTTTVPAMEYRPIPMLNKYLPPGSKLLLKGKIMCVNCVLFLDAQNVELLGGEVDTLLVVNAYENMLLKSLNRPITQTPKNQYPATNGDPVQPPHVQPQSRPPDTQMTISDFDNIDEDELLMQVDLDGIEQRAMQPENHQVALQRHPSPQPSTSSGVTAAIPDLIPDDSDLFDAQDFDLLAQIEQEAYKSNTTPSTSFDEFDAIVYGGQKPPPAPVPEPVPEPVPAPPPPPPKIFEKTYKYKIEGINLVSLDQLRQLTPAEREGCDFLVYAAYRSVTRRLKLCLEWSVAIMVDDGSPEQLEVRLDPRVMDELMGYQAAEVVEMKKRSAAQPALKEEVIQILYGFERKLVVLETFLKIAFEAGEIPTVKRLVPLKPVYKNILSKKVHDEDLRYMKDRLPK